VDWFVRRRSSPWMPSRLQVYHAEAPTPGCSEELPDLDVNDPGSRCVPGWNLHERCLRWHRHITTIIVINAIICMAVILRHLVTTFHLYQTPQRIIVKEGSQPPKWTELTPVQFSLATVNSPLAELCSELRKRLHDNPRRSFCSSASYSC